MKYMLATAFAVALMACAKDEETVPDINPPSKRVYATFDGVTADQVVVVIDRATQSDVVYGWSLDHDSVYTLWVSQYPGNVYRNDTLRIVDSSTVSGSAHVWVEGQDGFTVNLDPSTNGTEVYATVLHW